MPHDEPDADAPGRPMHSGVARRLDAQTKDQYRRILYFEVAWLQHSTAKEVAVAAKFGISIVRYYQLLEAALNTPNLHVDAAAQEEIGKLRVRRDRRRRRRSTSPTSD